MKQTRAAPPVIAMCLMGFATPTSAWEFTPGTPCVLTHATDTLDIELTYDPTVPRYSISLTQERAIVPGPLFSMQFEGALPIAISTDRHTYSADGRTISVTDSGFGNVLNGLQFNTQAKATLGEQQMEFPLAGAADAVAALRACDVLPSA